MTILETERLILREMDQEDFSDLAQMLQNPRVMVAYEHDFSDEDVQRWLDRQKSRYETYGFGLWAMILKKTGEMIGQAGLTMQPYKGKQVLEIGYLLKEAYWHHGYAREAAAGLKKYAFETLNREKVYAIIKTDNTPSQRVAESIGMTREDEFLAGYHHGNRPHFLYAVSRQGNPVRQ
ncbi:MAG TPA: GNAT family N-acetyltransferase [Firmicutes bacterium]|nr:GNAT family N-acetyltransferase [Bacillota bacterium]